ncbi:MAG: hypothetical protein A2600_07915 [Candidatus Lambdaproteobacteria bacterium RIFOXYD1_FULL_56_27]|uniref:N-acetylmuramoyl-L-alanine amidase n=1 Tax=Candidatus Lambdaproteobacteria bacterium RIFOXYD2_FULL_56_26 TaxID=1817773 RepID=A0A1F6GNI5_9PROT|nr:MAG: hypothetical protein A2557_06135 [Candidatus Lambdaproteobacteria bacterium RIFOXYD2_FULL_56_26]OGG99884.1 MAG: hypothetical protein A2426_09870 [Candidatus Lambdaproteobacteria bacterium RIFOXYC1_FULL_56_13]OGH09699.1 MAG: hypothetical protein A2600_07915 [Candidatus Lambdaproteobacteria bacterium RIFOXYD1_FULL_56_27]
MRVFWVAFLLFLLAPGLGLAELRADSVERDYQRAAQDFYRLYRPGPFRERADNFLKTIAKFEAIAADHPGHKHAPQALYNNGKLYHSLYKWSHNDRYLDQAIQAYRKLVISYPQEKIADDAQFEIGLIFEEYKDQPSQASVEYQKVIDLFPKGDFAPIARKKLEQLGPPTQDLRLAAPSPQPPANPPPVVPPPPASALRPGDLTQARYGGLSEKEEQQKKKKSLVANVEYWSNSDWSRLVINVADPVRFKYQVLKEDKAQGKGRRMYLDLDKSFLPRKFKDRIAAEDGLIKQARIAQFDKDTVRVVLDLASLDRIRVYPFESPDQYKIIVDILGSEAIADSPGPAAETAPATPVATAPAPALPAKNGPLNGTAPSKADVEATTLSRALGLKVSRVILDPGHGGRDPGAMAFGLKEKDLVLELALELRKILQQKNPEVEVMMTRETDKFIPLEARTAFANKNQGDIFVSIHLNAHRKSSVSGIETYYLNLTTDAYALSLAAKENQTSLKSIRHLQGLLHDLMTHSKIQESTQLAKLIQDGAVNQARSSNRIQLRSLGVKQAPFFVLLGARMPSILVEAGFITNKTENDLLRDPKYRKILALGIYQGLFSYMDRT